MSRGDEGYGSKSHLQGQVSGANQVSGRLHRQQHHNHQQQDQQRQQQQQGGQVKNKDGRQQNQSNNNYNSNNRTSIDEEEDDEEAFYDLEDNPDESIDFAEDSGFVDVGASKVSATPATPATPVAPAKSTTLTRASTNESFYPTQDAFTTPVRKTVQSEPQIERTRIILETTIPSHSSEIALSKDQDENELLSEEENRTTREVGLIPEHNTFSTPPTNDKYNIELPKDDVEGNEDNEGVTIDSNRSKQETESKQPETKSPSRGIYIPKKYESQETKASQNGPNDGPNISDSELANMKMFVTNLETGERCRIDQVEEAFPEVALAMTLNDVTDSPEGTESSTTATSEMESKDKEQPRASAGFLGFLSNLFKFGRPSSLRAGATNSIKTKCTKRASSSSTSSTSQLVSSSQSQSSGIGLEKLRTQQDLTDLKIVQDLQFHTGPPWTFAWSHCGRFLATAGHDTTLAIWAVCGTHFSDEIDRRVLAAAAAAQMNSAAGGHDGSSSMSGPEAKMHPGTQLGGFVDYGPEGAVMVKIPESQGGRMIVNPTPYLLLSGHRGDVVDLAWSRANFILTASIDRTVRLWHLTKPKCIMMFQHADFVTSIAFHPIEDRYFVSGSFDRKLRVWRIPTNEVVAWVQTPHIITAVAWSPDGRTICAGLYNGRVFVYEADQQQLKYRTQLECRNRSGRYREGRKVTGLQFSPDGRFLLVSTNDSRIRLYRMDDFYMIGKFKGLTNTELQIKATFNQDGSRIICGSEQDQVYIWDVVTDGSHSDEFESFRAHSGPVTVAQFVPRSAIVTAAGGEVDESKKVRQLILTTGSTGEMRFFENRGAPIPL